MCINTNIYFADDIVVLTTSQKDLQATLDEMNYRV